MKRQILTAFTAATLLVALTVVVQAQTATQSELIATVPFEFHVGDRTMPAGIYRVTCINPSSSSRVLRFRSADGRRTALIQTRNAIGNTQDDARVVFRRYDNAVYFAEAWFSADSVGLAARKSRQEKADEKLASAKPKIETITLVRAR